MTDDELVALLGEQGNERTYRRLTLLAVQASPSRSKVFATPAGLAGIGYDGRVTR